MEGCLFCSLKNSKDILYKNEHAYIILDINPLSTGHMLVIPNEHAEKIHQMENDSLINTVKLLHLICKKMGYEKYNILQNNGHIQSVPHVHFHIVPAISDENNLKINWKTIITDEKYFTEERKKFYEYFQ